MQHLFRRARVGLNLENHECILDHPYLGCHAIMIMIGRRLLDSTRWLLLVTIVASAWLWGTTRPWTQEVICCGLILDTALYGSALLALRRYPRIHLLALSVILLILAQGWILAWNTPPSIPGNMVISDHHAGILPYLPVFASRAESFRAMLLITGLLGAFCIAADLSANRLWRMRLWKTIALTGTSIVVLGLAQRLTNAPAIFWNVYENTGETFFGVFRYHANAGAYINIILPMIAGLALLSVLEKWNEASRVFWIISTLATLAAACVNVSRGAIAVTGIILLLACVWVLPAAFFNYYRRPKKLLRPLLFFVAAAILLIFSFGPDRLISRWDSQGLTDSQRILTYQVVMKNVIPQTGLFGAGPGNFERVFSEIVSEQNLPVKGRWDKAHNDHLQTIVEWGWIGYTAWVILFMGALWKGIQMAQSGSSLATRTLGTCGTLSLVGVLLHAGIDFPLQIISIQLYAGVIAGMLWSMQREQTGGVHLQRKTRTGA